MAEFSPAMHLVVADGHDSAKRSQYSISPEMKGGSSNRSASSGLILYKGSRVQAQHRITPLSNTPQPVLVERDAYLLEVSRYVDLNHVPAGMVKRPGDWAWSSYRAQAGQTENPAWLDSATLHRRLAPLRRT